MSEINGYDRILILEQDKITHLLTIKKNIEKHTAAPQVGSEKTLTYLSKYVLENQLNFKDLMVFHLKNSPLPGLDLIKELVKTKEYKNSQADIMILSDILNKKEHDELNKLGIDKIITDNNNITNILAFLTEKNQESI